MTINAFSKSDGIQNLKITDLYRHLLFDSSEDPALFAGVDDIDDKDTSLAGVHGNDTSLAGVAVPNTTITTNNDDDSDTESNHNSVDPMRLMTIQAKHQYTAPEATYQFTIQLVNHRNILQMRKSWMMKNYLSWKPKFPYYIDLKEFLSHHLYYIP